MYFDSFVFLFARISLDLNYLVYWLWNVKQNL